MYIEICANCGDWEKCKAAGALPNDYCGMYYSSDLTNVESVEKHCENWRKEHRVCNGCRYSTEDYDCRVFAGVFTRFEVREEENNG